MKTRIYATSAVKGLICQRGIQCRVAYMYLYALQVFSQQDGFWLNLTWDGMTIAVWPTLQSEAGVELILCRFRSVHLYNNMDDSELSAAC